MKVTDRQILEAIKDYRNQPLVKGQHGPPSFEHLAEYLLVTERTDELLSRAALSLRCRALVEEGYLTGTRQWACPGCGAVNYTRADEASGTCSECQSSYNMRGVHSSVYAFSLRLTEDGREYLGNGHE
jgi:ribosomal protein L37AE/L43A